MDMGVTTVAALGGDLTQLTNVPFKDRPTQPHHFGQQEPFLIVWTMIQSPPGRTYTVELYNPAGNLEGSETRTISSYIRYGWDPFVWNFAGVPASDFGEWKVLIKQNGHTIKAHTFEVQAETYYGPRFFPMAGKSLRMTTASIQDQFTLSPLGSSTPAFELLHAPAFVSLQDQRIQVQADQGLNTRNTYFQVKATDELGLSDTMWYHIVAPNAPRGNLNATESPAQHDRQTLSLLPIAPNPTADPFTLSYQLAESSTISISLFNSQGQRVKMLVQQRQSKGAYQLAFSGATLGLVPGVYWIKYLAASEQQVQQLVVY